MGAKDKISLLEGHLSETDTTTINKALEEAKKAGIREVMEWADLPCPHGTLTAETSPASRRECEECWQDGLKKWGIGEAHASRP